MATNILDQNRDELIISKQFKNFELSLAIDQNTGTVMMGIQYTGKGSTIPILHIIDVEPQELEKIENMFNIATMQVLAFIKDDPTYEYPLEPYFKQAKTTGD